MSKKLGIIAIHGMGKTKVDFAEDLEEILAQHLGQEIWKEIHFDTVYYQHLLQFNESRVWRNMQRLPSTKLRWSQLRKFMLFGFSDAVSLEHKNEAEGSVYKRTQHVISDILLRTKRNLEGKHPPVIIIAQSLGGQVISNYIWDSQVKAGIWQKDVNDSLYIKSFDSDEEEFMALKTMRFLFTTGCNIPIFVSGFDKIEPFKKDEMHPDFQWKNYYDRDDILGWPLKPLSSEYEQLVEDVEIDSGTVLTGFTPFSHLNYWSDPDFHKPLMKAIRSLLIA